MTLIPIKASVLRSGQVSQFLPLQHLRGGGARTLCRSEHERMRKAREFEAQPWIDEELPALWETRVIEEGSLLRPADVFVILRLTMVTGGCLVPKFQRQGHHSSRQGENAAASLWICRIITALAVRCYRSL
jgi:hypothetical protein